MTAERQEQADKLLGTMPKVKVAQTIGVSTTTLMKWLRKRREERKASARKNRPTGDRAAWVCSYIGWMM